jgi:DNA polymerase-1
MRHLSFVDPVRSNYPLCLLIPQIRKDDIYHAYVAPFAGIAEEDLLVLDLHQSATAKKTPVAEMKDYFLSEVVPVLQELSVEYLLVADGDYFKALTKAAKVEPNLGYVLDCAYGPWKVAYVPNHRAIFYDPDRVKTKIAQAITGVINHRAGNYERPGASIIHFAAYPRTPDEIEQWLERLILEDRPLTCDIEAFSLKHHSAGIGTVTLCWSKHEGIAFPVDYVPIPGATEAPFGQQIRNDRVRKALLSFFMRFGQKLTYHSISYDVYVLIYQLFMEHLLDTEGLLLGLDVMLRNWDDTKLITYLATNSCAGNRLGLKVQAQEFAGSYALDDEGMKDITRIPLDQLLEYNLIDGLSTWFVKEKHWDTMVADQQLEIYEEIFKPAIVDIIQMQLTGMPVNMERAKEVNGLLAADEAAAKARIMSSPIIKQFEHQLELKHVAKRNSELKKKQIKLGDEPQEFNPNSDPQMRELLFGFLDLPVINLTDSKMASTDGETIEALLNRTEDPEIKDLLEAFQLYAIVGTLTTNFMPSILGAVKGPDGWHYLFGNFNLGGTLSGRLSSSGPNLQNLPSTGKGHKIKLKYAKMIKSCFQAPPGWLFVGIDFSSLEDRISALTTKDPNKLKVYTDGYDGHSLRAFAYWPDKMPDIDPSSVDSINSIAKKYKPLRDRSKNPTFTLTYQGTEHALEKKYGFTKAEALEIVERYQGLYQVSIQWVEDKLNQAMRDGYITGAFGLRLRTPLLKQVIRGTSRTPYEAQAEGRTAGNALGQSWCLLNSRASSEFMTKVRKSEHRLTIRPCAQIHDASYYIIRDDIGDILYANEHLVKAVQWQDHPEIYHDEVKLGGELSIFHPSWSEEIVIPNGASEDEIFATIAQSV